MVNTKTSSIESRRISAAKRTGWFERKTDKEKAQLTKKLKKAQNARRRREMRAKTKLSPKKMGRPSFHRITQ